MGVLSIPVEEEVEEALDSISLEEGREKADLLGDIVRDFLGERRRHLTTSQLRSRLDGLVEQGWIAGSTVSLAAELWGDLSAASDDRLSVPHGSPGPDGQILYAWDDPEEHMEVEVFPDGRAEFFSRNRRTGALWDADMCVGEPIPDDAVAHLERFRVRSYV